jgi:hypothetical protein
MFLSKTAILRLRNPTVICTGAGEDILRVHARIAQRLRGTAKALFFFQISWLSLQTIQNWLDNFL